MKNTKDYMKISQLSARSKKPVSTIRYYLEMGLLPEPITSQRHMSYYTYEHLKRLDQIDKLKKRGLTLATIAEFININPEEIPSEFDTNVTHLSKREVIIRAAVEFFREKGYDLTNINDIIRRASVGNGTFYQYFNGKEDLFFKCAEKIFYDIGEEDPAIYSEPDGLKRLWKRSLRFLKFHLHMINMLNLLRGSSLKNPERITIMVSEVMKTITDPVRSDLQLAYAQGKIRFDNIDFLACLIMGMSEYLSYYFQVYPEEHIDIVHKKVWDMIMYTISPA